MRRVVVLPAPLGPSRPVISPSRALKPTPRTAWTGPVRALKVLCRSWTSIMSGLPAVGAGKRRHGLQAFQARRVERRRIGGLDELGGELGHAPGHQYVVPLAGQYQVAPVGQVPNHRVAVARRSNRLELPAD